MCALMLGLYFSCVYAVVDCMHCDNYDLYTLAIVFALSRPCACSNTIRGCSRYPNAIMIERVQTRIFRDTDTARSITPDNKSAFPTYLLNLPIL